MIYKYITTIIDIKVQLLRCVNINHRKCVLISHILCATCDACAEVYNVIKKNYHQKLQKCGSYY